MAMHHELSGAKSLGGWRAETLRSLRLLRVIYLFFISAILISSCSASTPPPSALQVLSVYSSFAAEPWLSELYNCAATQNNVVLSRVDDPNSAEIALQLGEPALISSFAYQFDSEEILIVTHRQSSVQNLTLEEAQALFMGLGDADASVQVWVYVSDADVQRVFDQFVMEGRSVTSSALIAVNPQQMSDTLVNQSNAVGILPRHWKVGDVRDVYSVGNVPVLAITQIEPQGAVRQLIGCLQE